MCINFQDLLIEIALRRHTGVHNYVSYIQTLRSMVCFLFTMEPF